MKSNFICVQNDTILYHFENKLKLDLYYLIIDMEKKTPLWVSICKWFFIACWIYSVSYAVKYNLILPYMIGVLVIIQASDIEY